MELFNNIGIDLGYFVIGITVLLLIVLILCIILYKNNKNLVKKYNKMMKGADGRNIEDGLLKRLDELEDLLNDNTKNKEDILANSNNIKYTFQKFAIEKYDAFKEMGGKLSFSLCMLTENNDGFVLTSMHSNNEGCYTYIKEIIKGESFVLLGDEEKKVLEMAKKRKTVLDE